MFTYNGGLQGGTKAQPHNRESAHRGSISASFAMFLGPMLSNTLSIRRAGLFYLIITTTWTLNETLTKSVALPTHLKKYAYDHALESTLMPPRVGT